MEDDSRSGGGPAHRQARRDLIVISVVSALIFAISVPLELFESVVRLAEKPEVLELDELLIVLMVLPLALAAFASRRWNELHREVAKRERIERDLLEAREELEDRVEQQIQRGQTYGLTFRELTVLHLVTEGKADKEIAWELAISPLTVNKHLANIRAKMGARSRTEAGVRAVRERLVPTTPSRDGSTSRQLTHESLT